MNFAAAVALVEGGGSSFKFNLDVSMREEDGSSKVQSISYPLYASATNNNL